VQAKVSGVRRPHQIDVWVRFKKCGLETKWVVECKYWNSAIPKEKVLTLKSIVEDVGADRGVLISSANFQAGAIRAAEKTNITLTNLEELKETAKDDLVASVINRIETRALELRYELRTLHTFKQIGPQSFMITPLPAVDGAGLIRTMGELAALEHGFELVRLKKPPYIIGYEDAPSSGFLAVSTLEAFIAAASKVIDKV